VIEGHNKTELVLGSGLDFEQPYSPHVITCNATHLSTLLITMQNNNFQNSSTARLGSKFATKRSVYITPHPKDIAKHPSETVVKEF